MPEATDSSGSILFDFADQLLSDIDAGRLRPLAHYLARFPGHEEKVAREYIALTSGQADAGTKQRRGDGPLERIGPYKVLAVLGRGGQGVVYRALDARLDRTVALKVLTIPVASVSQGRRTRFRREAEILARLDHPGICTVLDADLDGDSPYIAMRFIEGETLAAALIRVREENERKITPSSRSDSGTSASRLLAPQRALELAETLSFFERVARALHAAHEAGVVHRDVKPGNIMVSSEGAPVVLDFGLARDDGEESAQLTRSDEVFGTPAYISPEQLESGRNVDRRTDVYSLGVVLYECLTLTRPFQGDSSAALAESIRRAPMPPPRKANPSLPADLVVVLETALEKDVERRYPTALELAEELRRVREYEPIVARPAGPLLRLRRWGQRNPVIATGTIGSIVALSIALTIALVLLRRVRTEERRKEAALALYEGGWFRDEASSSLPDAQPRALQFAIAAAERDPGLASNRVLLAALDSLYERQLLVGHERMIFDADIDSGARRIATGSLDGTARVWDVETGREIAVFQLGGGTVYSVRFAPDGKHLAFAGTGGRALLVALDEPAAVAVELTGHASDVHGLDFSPDGTRIVTASRDRTARVFDVVTGREVAVCAGHTGSVAEARFLRDGARILTRSAEPLSGSTTSESDATKRIFDARTGAELRVLAGSPAMATAIDASADSRWIVAACEDKTAQLWDLAREDAAPAHVFVVAGRFHSARFSPDGSRLALSWDAGAKVVEVATGADLYVLPNHGHRAIVRIEWNPDGRELATVAYDDALRIFRAEDGALLRTCRGSARQIMGLAWSPDGSFLATWHRQSTASVWYGAERPFLPVLRGHLGPVRTAHFSPDGRHALTSSDDGTARSWTVPSGAPEAVFDPLSAGLSRSPLVGAAFDPTAERVATTDAQGRVLLWNAHEMRLERRFDARGAPGIAAAFSPDGARLAFADGPGAVRVFELASGAERSIAAHEGVLTALRFSPDGRRLATGGSDRRVCAWDVTSESGRELAWRTAPFESELRALTQVFDVAFSPDGRWIAAAQQNTRIEVFDVDGNRVTCTPVIATPGLVAFAPEQSLLLGTSKYGRTMTMWRFPDPGATAELDNRTSMGLPGEHHTNSMTSLSKARAAPWAVTGSLDRTVHLWDLSQRRCVAAYPGHTDAVYDVDVNADATWIVSASGDGTARLWPRDLLGAARAARPTGFEAVIGPLPTPAAGR